MQGRREMCRVRVVVMMKEGEWGEKGVGEEEKEGG